MNEIARVSDYLRSLQNRIVAELEQLDGKATFLRDAWERPEGGGGESRVLKRGRIFEQAGVNFSHVFGNQLPPSATKRRPDLATRASTRASPALPGLRKWAVTLTGSGRPVASPIVRAANASR